MANKKKFTLKPYLTAMENLWEGCNAACRYILGKKRLRLKNDEWQELLTTFTTETVSQFLRVKIGQHKYNRDYDFYSNCYSCAWSISGYRQVVDKYLQDIKNRLNTTSLSLQTGGDSEDVLENMIADTGVHPLWNRPQNNKTRETGRRSGERVSDTLNRLWAIDDEEMKADGSYHDWQAIHAHRAEVREQVLAKEAEDNSRLSEIRRQFMLKHWASRKAHLQDRSPECTTGHPQKGLRQP